MRYSFHGHDSTLDLHDVVAFEPELCERLARQLKEPNVEDAVGYVVDLYGAKYVTSQAANLEVIGKRWAELASVALTPNDQERVRAIPERLSFRLDGVWREGRAAVFLVLRAISMRTGCSMHDAPLHMDNESVKQLMELIVDGLRQSFAAHVDAALAVSLVESAVKDGRGAEPSSSNERTATA